MVNCVAIREHLRELLRDEGKVKYTDSFLDHALNITLVRLTPSSIKSMEDADWDKADQGTISIFLSNVVRYIQSIDEGYANTHTEELMSFLKIREAIGDHEGQLMQDEVADKIREIMNELEFYKKRHGEFQARNTELVMENRRLKEKSQETLETTSSLADKASDCHIKRSELLDKNQELTKENKWLKSEVQKRQKIMESFSNQAFSAQTRNIELLNWNQELKRKLKHLSCPQKDD